MPAPIARALPRAAVFDWDGTIVDTLPLIYRANVVVLGEIGITLSREWFRERYTPDWRAAYRELGVPEDRWDAVAARWSEEMLAGRPRAIPWVRGALRGLARSGVRLGLVTASTRNVVEPNLARLGLTSVFAAAYYADDVTTGKPHPEALLRALADLDVKPSEAIYVGDTAVDLAMATAAGTPFAAVAGTTDEAEFRAAGVDRVWSDVGAWADDLLGRAARERPPGRRQSSGRA